MLNIYRITSVFRGILLWDFIGLRWWTAEAEVNIFNELFVNPQKSILLVVKTFQDGAIGNGLACLTSFSDFC